MTPALPTAPIIITLVHGTFDRNARWTQPQSLLSYRLKEELGSSLHLNRFEWTGYNSHHDREVAATQLIDHIASTAMHFPRAPHCLIGHSHGGNLIKWALERAPSLVSTSVAGVVTISTPFLMLRKRDLFSDVQAVIFVWRVVLICTLCLLWAKVYQTYYQPIMSRIFPALRPIYIWDTELGAFLGLLTIMAMLVGPMCLVLWAVNSKSESMESSLQSFLKRRQGWLAGSAPENTKLSQSFLCIYTKTDEVNILFHSANLIIVLSRVVGIIVHFSRLCYGRHVASVVREFRVPLIAVGSIIGVIAFIGEMAGRGIVGALMETYVTPIIIIGFLMSIFLPFVVVVGAFVFGIRGTWDSLVADVSHSLKPVDVADVKVFVVDSNVLKAYLSRKNTHTEIMYDDRVAREIVSFIGNLVLRRPR